MIAEIQMAKIKTYKKDRRKYYLLSIYNVLSIVEEKFLIHKQNATDEKTRSMKEFHIRTGHRDNVKLRNVTYYACIVHFMKWMFI